MSAPKIAISRPSICLLWCCLIQLGLLSAQSQTRYQVLQSSGPIPADFLRSAQTKYQAELEQWADSSEEIQESARRFLQEDYYYLNQLLRSGQLLFGDPLTQYLNRLTDHILRFRPEIRAQLRVYTVKSSIANAASTYDGIIFVNMGLLARVENEAQLAFVLSHEISHFVERHTLKSYLKYEQKERSAGRKKDFEALQNVHYRYSRQLELRADSLGLQLYLEAGYRPEAIAEVFAILEVANDDINWQALDRSLLESSSLRFSKEQWPDTLEYELDTLLRPQTHPHPKARKKALWRMSQQQAVSANAKANWLGEKAFREARDLSRFELCQRYLLERSFESAFYHAASLLETKKHQAYLYKQMAFSLYALAKHTHAGEFWEVHQDYELLAGPSHQLAYLMEQLSAAERTVLALSFAWRARNTVGEDPTMERMCEELMLALGQYYVESLADLEGDAASQNESKIVQYGLTDLLQDQAFREAAQKQIQLGLQRRKAFQIETPSTETELAQEKVDGFALGLDSLILIEPTYQRVDRRKSPSIQLTKTEQMEQFFRQALRQQAKALDLSMQMLTYDSLRVGEVDRLNDIQLFQEWLFDLRDNQTVGRVSILQEDVAELARRYETNYFAWTQLVAITDRRPGRKMILWMGLFPPILPYSLYYTLTPAHNLYLYTTIYDVERGRALLVSPQQVRMKDRKDVINSVTYDLILQIKSE